MSEEHTEAERFEGTCPHCHKPFVAELLSRPSARQRGFKCPHCKLFVPRDRVGGETLAPPRS